jgi:capsular exopolysaccharide synthesis family protein
LQNTLLGAAVGLLIMGGVAFLIEYLDDTLKTPDDVAHVMRTPVIGYLTVIPDLKEVKDLPYVGAHPRSPVAEAFRGLRTNLEFAGVDKPLKTILITSTSPRDGKTTIAANLAVAMAQGNKRVVLLDGDLRRPAIHRMFGMANRSGLSDVFRGHLKLADALHRGTRDRLGVITSGSLPPNPTELLDSEKMTQILAALRESADVVIIDSPPLLVADAPVLAAKVDGVLLVVEPGKTHADAAQAVVEQLDWADARVVGVVFNRIPRKRADYYGGYRYSYSTYYQDHNEYYYMDGHSQNGRPSANGGQRQQQGWLGKRLNKLRNSGKK